MINTVWVDSVSGDCTYEPSIHMDNIIKIEYRNQRENENFVDIKFLKFKI